MGGSSQPFLYDPPPRFNPTDPHNGFDPRAVSQPKREASPSKQRPKPKQEGPLLNFNRHPDSYLVLPTRDPNQKTLGRKTKAAIKWTRWVQCLLRVCTLFGAIGMLICVILIRGTAETEGWIIRLPPGLDIILSIYGVYHLIRPAKARTPASSASYHFFALVMDAGLVPFYVFTAMLARNHFLKRPGTEGRWRSYFQDDVPTNKVLYSAWLIAMTGGGFHVASFVLDLYLVLVFRKISHLPPDMNPLEDNLTSRNKHKHKNSEITVGSDKRTSIVAEKHLSLDGPGRHPQADPLLPEEGRGVPVPFLRTREGSGSGSFYSPHNPTTARLSRGDLSVPPLYSQPASNRSSVVNMPGYHRNESFASSEVPKRGTYVDLPPTSAGSRPPTYYSRDDNRSSYAPSLSPSKRHSLAPVARNDGRHRPATPQRRSDLKSDNWFVVTSSPDSDSEDDGHKRRSARAPTASRKPAPYASLRAASPDISSDEEPEFTTGDDNHFTRYPATNPVVSTPPHARRAEADPSPARMQPLGMNPPTPQPPLTPTSATAVRKGDTRGAAGVGGAASGKFYGTLAAAVQGLRPVSPSPRRGAERRRGEPEVAGSPRVVSRTGVDVDDGDLGAGVGKGWGVGGTRRRDVSGKVAEEGRGWGYGVAVR